jgi:hypothetical protein
MSSESPLSPIDNRPFVEVIGELLFPPYGGLDTRCLLAMAAVVAQKGHEHAMAADLRDLIEDLLDNGVSREVAVRALLFHLRPEDLLEDQPAANDGHPDPLGAPPDDIDYGFDEEAERTKGEGDGGIDWNELHSLPTDGTLASTTEAESLVRRIGELLVQADSRGIVGSIVTSAQASAKALRRGIARVGSHPQGLQLLESAYQAAHSKMVELAQMLRDADRWSGDHFS